MQPHPYPEFTECRRQFRDARSNRACTPDARAVAQVHTVSARVLGNHEQLFHARFDELFRFFQNLLDRTTYQIAAHRRNDAEAAAVVAALGDLEVGVVPRREAYPLWRDKVEKRIMRLGQVCVHRLHHLCLRVRTGNREHRGMRASHDIALGAEAAGHDDPAVLVQGLADRCQRFLDRRVDKAAGVDHHQVGIGVLTDNFIALGAQLRQDVLRIDQRLGTAETDESHPWRGRRAFGYSRFTHDYSILR